MKKIKRGDADWLPQSSLPDAFRISHIVLRHCASTRAAAMLVSHVSMCPHLTHSCDTIHIPAALSLPPYQRGDRDYDTNLNPQCKSEEKFSSRSSLVERHQVLSSTGKEVKLFLQVQRRNYWVSSFIRTA